MKIKPLNVTGNLTIPAHTLVGDLSLKNVSFAYATRPEQNVISNLNLDIKNGETVALCGPSGSGMFCSNNFYI